MKNWWNAGRLGKQQGGQGWTRKIALHAVSVACVGVGVLWAGQASAGIEACGGVRLEGSAKCRLHFGKTCNTECETVSYNKSCSYSLYRDCSNVCTTSVTRVCVDDCSEFCEADCTLGLDVVCQHNCFPECARSCPAECAGADDPEFCEASCEANCDGECDSQCADLPVDASCYKHCSECCTGTCRATSTMSCQIECQQTEVEECTTERTRECQTGCEEGGALFCDGDFLLAGEAMDDCAAALDELGVSIDGWGDQLGLSDEEQDDVEDQVLGEDGIVDQVGDIVQVGENGVQIGDTTTTNTTKTETETTTTRNERTTTTDENGNPIQPKKDNGGCSLGAASPSSPSSPSPYWLLGIAALVAPLRRRYTRTRAQRVNQIGG